MGDVLLARWYQRARRVRGRLEWSNPEGEAPPQRVLLSRDAAAKLTLETDSTGACELELPADTYQLTLAANAPTDHAATATQ